MHTARGQIFTCNYWRSCRIRMLRRWNTLQRTVPDVQSLRLRSRPSFPHASGAAKRHFGTKVVQFRQSAVHGTFLFFSSWFIRLLFFFSTFLRCPHDATVWYPVSWIFCQTTFVLSRALSLHPFQHHQILRTSVPETLRNPLHSVLPFSSIQPGKACQYFLGFSRHR